MGRLARSQHSLVAILSAWLILTSPWMHMYRTVPRNAGLLGYGHVALGMIVLAMAVTFTISCTRQGQWRVYFPWLAGTLAPVGRDLRALWRLEVPTAEGGGLFALIEGFLLLAVLATGVTGAAWLVVQGSAEAVTLRHYHIIAVRGMIALLVLHIVAVSTHVLDFIRE